MNLKSIYAAAIAAALSITAVSCTQSAKKNAEPQSSDLPKYECIAYAWEADGPLPPADMVTAINYLGAYPNSSSGVTINNFKRLQKIIDLKKENPNLKVILSMGGADAGTAGWPEMACNDANRAKFVDNLKHKVENYGLDGVDFDWEFPANKEEEEGYIKLFRDVRQALGDDKVVTAAVGFGGNGFDLKEAMKYLDYINLMTYDMGWQAPYHHTSLRRSPLSGVSTVEESLDSCLSKGLEYKDIVLGLAFYGRGDSGANFQSWTDYKDIAAREGMEERWDSVACVPYIVDSNGTLIIGYENPQSLKIKCDYIKEKGLRGGMYWRTELDNESKDLTRTVAKELMGK